LRYNGTVKVEVHPDAEAELASLPEGERHAMQNAFEKLAVHGDQLPFPHSSKVKGAAQLRELRPRAGRSAWRAFYRRIADTLVIGAIGPEARAKPHEFRRAVRSAGERLIQLEEQRKT
jgi:hypothetical protein